MMRFTADEVDRFSESEMRHTIAFALAIGVVSLIVALLAIPFTYAVMPDLTMIIPGLVIALGSATLMLVLILGLRRVRRHREDFVDEVRENGKLYRELERKKTAVPAIPPPAPPTALITTNVTRPNEIGGIDERDLKYFCEQVLATKDWTERRWLGMTLPNGTELTKGEQGGYNRVVNLLVEKGIIIERTPRNTGKLAVTNLDDMLRALRRPSPTPPAQPPQNVAQE